MDVAAPRVCLAVTCHDPLGRFRAGIESAAEALADDFVALAVNATAETHRATIDVLEALDLSVSIVEHGAGTIGIGAARREALALGLRGAADRLLYSDLDHILRWLITSPDDVEACLSASVADLLVIGRSPAAMAETPERLRLTEGIVNRVYALANGLDEPRDLMIAMRLMNRWAAETIVRLSRDDAITNDVTWPMLVRAHGGTVEYVDSDAIRYLAGEDFGDDVDRRDHDPREWRQRMAMANEHVRAITDFEPACPSALTFDSPLRGGQTDRTDG